MTMTPSTEGNPMPLMLTRDTSFQLAFEPTNFEQAWRMATIAQKIQLCGVKTVEEAFIRIAAGRELGLTTFQSLRLVYVVKGRPALDASLMLALCLNHPQCEYFDLVETTAERAIFRAKRKGRDEVPLEWTIAQAEKAGLLAKGKDSDNADKSSWHTYPDAMLRARCIAALARIVFPDALNGIYAREELVGDDVVGPATYMAPVASVPANVVDAVHAEPTPATAAPAAPPTEPSAPANAPDLGAQAAGLRKAIKDAKTDEEKATVRKAIKAFVKDGGSPFEAELKALYETTHTPAGGPT